MLAIEYSQIILTLCKSKPSCIFHSRTHFRFHKFSFLIISYSPCFSPFPILTTQNYNFCILKRNALQSVPSTVKSLPVPVDSSRIVSFTRFVFFLNNTKRRTEIIQFVSHGIFSRCTVPRRALLALRLTDESKHSLRKACGRAMQPADKHINYHGTS